MTDYDSKEVAAAPDGYRLTDAGNARRFVAHTAGRVRYVHAWGRWIVFYDQDGVWKVDHNDALVLEAAKAVPRALMAMVADLNGNERDLVFKAAVRAESASALSAMVRLARGIDGVIISHDELDADLYILNVKNGVVDLRTGELLPHDPAWLCTMQAPVVYDPEVRSELWERCLERWQPDPEVRAYLQREAGAGATGHPTETVGIHHGDGGNGKSKYFGALGHVLGPYAVEPHKSLLIHTRHEQHATVLASLFRARLAVASETGVSDRLSESNLKNITGGDRLRAHRMREDEWSFDPSHTLVIFSNNRPKVRGQDEGIWRRIRLVPWAVTIPEHERDEKLAERLTAEATGILTWMVEGARTYISDGLRPPEEVTMATAGYRAESDTVVRFLSEAGIKFDPDGRIMSSALTDAHESWCKENGEHPKSHWPMVTARL